MSPAGAAADEAEAQDADAVAERFDALSVGSEDELSEFERQIADELPPADSDSDDETLDPYYFVQAREVPRGDIYQACRVGDLQRVAYLVEHDGVEINARDRWDSVPLYYTCLAGHIEVARYLLEAGAVCNEFTFDGDRCHYASLTMAIRNLLRQYEARPPPLAPLASALRTLSPDFDMGDAAPSTSDVPWSDFTFHICGERIPLHRAILAARSRFFRRRLLHEWRPQEGSGHREVHLVESALQPLALKAVLAFLYTERLDFPTSDLDAVLRVVRKCCLADLAAAIRKEMTTVKYYFKTTHREEAPRRVVLQPGSVPAEARLSADLGRLRELSAQLESSGTFGLASDFADLVVEVEGRRFRCHCCILAARSDYFRALLERSEGFNEPQKALLEQLKGSHEPPRPNALTTQQAAARANEAVNAQLPMLTVHDVSADVFRMVLHFMYTDEVGELDGQYVNADGANALFDAADRYLVFAMKRTVAEAIIAKVDQAKGRNIGNLESVCRLLLVSDLHSVALLRQYCLDRLAALFDVVSSRHGPEHEISVFEAFVAAVAPKDGRELLDGSRVLGASRGNITGGGLGGLGIGTVLQDLRETYLEAYGGTGVQRDACAARFDRRLLAISRTALQHSSAAEMDVQYGGSTFPPDTDLDLDTLLEFCAQELSQEQGGRAYYAPGSSNASVGVAPSGAASSQASALWPQAPLPFVPMTGHHADVSAGLSPALSGWFNSNTSHASSSAAAPFVSSQPVMPPVIPARPASGGGAAPAASTKGSHGDGSSSDEKEKPRTANGAIDHREKNKRAQRRFRERQKARLQESEQRASDLAAELAKVKMERSMLESRNAILEKILELRGGSQDTLRHQGSRSDLAALAQADTSFPETADSSQLLTLTVRDGETLQLSTEQMRALPRKEVSRMWKEYVNKMAVCLVDGDGDGDTPNGRRIRELLEELVSFSTCYASVNPKGWIALRCMRLEDTQMAGEQEPTCQMWSSIAKAMNLSPEQKQKMLQLRRFYLTRLAAILRQRQEVSMSLLRTVPGYAQRTARNTIATGHLKSLDAFEQLKSNLSQEQECIQQFAAAIRTIITPYQVAIAIVQSYPWAPDSLAICNCVAKAESEPPLETLFNLPQADKLMLQGSSSILPLAPLGTTAIQVAEL
ncbi:hypothetical protein WJX72_009170 [[Myrmecia] bisecta]|uniref:BTB domain-containing protein n=1 Tax=[Myrmecia] bisecta TaxID=41462 RepID=A0AAW1R7P3_9CHLO